MPQSSDPSPLLILNVQVTAAKPMYAGNTFFTTSVSISSPYHDTISSLVGPGMFLTCDSGHQIIAQRLADGSYQINISLPVTEGWATSSTGAALIAKPQALREFLLQFYADWAPTATDLIRKSDGAFRPWPLYSLPLEAASWKSVPGLTLVGDAAHLEIPDGEGVNRALTDGVSLARRIAAHYCGSGDDDGKDGDLDAAVREYEAEMLPRVRREREENKTKVMLLWAPDAPNSFVEAVMGGHVGQE